MRLDTINLPGLLVLLLTAVLTGCNATRYELDDDQLAHFLAAGPVVPELDESRIMPGLGSAGPYKLSHGDLLEINGPARMFASAGEAVQPGMASHLVRIDGQGRIHLPVGGYIQAVGRTIGDLEEAVVSSVYPRFLRSVPTVVVRVSEYCRVPVAIMGAVEAPGVHRLRHDELTLYDALTAAGGIAKSNNLVVGAKMIKIRRKDETREEGAVLPVKGLNIPFSNFELQGGETIEVVRYEPDTFTVIGLVENPGAFEYPPEVQYNLMQALGVAGGVDLIASPPYATIFRRDALGNIVPGTFEISGNGMVESSGLAIKPGDVIVVQQTPATWTRSLLAQITRIQIGFFADRTVAN